MTTKSNALKFVICIGIVSLCADATYEGGRSIAGAYLNVLGNNRTLEHLIQFVIVLEGAITCDIYPAIDPQRCYLSGSVISYGYTEFQPSRQRMKIVDIYIEPQHLSGDLALCRVSVWRVGSSPNWHLAQLVAAIIRPAYGNSGGSNDSDGARFGGGAGSA